MELEEKILEFMRRKDYSPLRLDELHKALGGDGKLFRKLKKILPRMVRAGTIAQVKRDRYCLPSDADLVSGRLLFRNSGSAKLLPDTPADGSPPPPAIHVRAEDTGTAFHGDRVVVRIERKRRRGGFRERYAQGDDLPFGSVVKILERAFASTTGTLMHTRYYWTVRPDDPRIAKDILVPDPARSPLFPQPKDGEKVVVRLNEWVRRSENPTGEIEKVLGESHTPLAEYRAILFRYHLSPKFPDAVAAELRSIPEKVDPKEMRGRLDLRKVFTLTIDPDDAKDFDDALSVENLPDGKTRIGIHIADVSHYVRTGTALDVEARARGNSTYLVGTVIPMLPHALSGGICSLVEGEPRLTKSVFATFDSDGNVLETQFANTVIASRKRLTYGQALALMTEDENRAIRALPAVPAHRSGHPGRALADLNDTEISELRKNVRKLADIARKLRAKRMHAGALDLDMPEVKIYVDADGFAERIEQLPHDESHQLVEEFMLLANETVARELRRVKLPFISRVHDAPDAEKLIELREEMLASSLKIGDLSKRSEMMKLLEILKTRDDAYPLRIRVLRSLKQACYRPSPDGHYGLAKTDYAHFTSPIRRYADLTVHRVFDFYLQKNHLPTAPAKKLPVPALAELAGTSDHVSETERSSMEAERESVKVKLLEFFEREVERKKKNVFEAIITDIRSIGLFVELKVSQAFGLIPLSSMTDDLYQVTPDASAVVGRRSRKRYALGQIVPVVVWRVDRFRRTMDFRLVSENESEKSARGNARRKRR
ncbi:MAG: RNB domain-containing ribonuclease [Opitutales bacterium]|nr:RNB domain-containing ribonuclease [Opitutales bacterium]